MPKWSFCSSILWVRVTPKGSLWVVEASVCDINILSVAICYCGNLIWLQRCFIWVFRLSLSHGKHTEESLVWSRNSADVCKNAHSHWDHGGLALQTLWCWMFIRSGFTQETTITGRAHWMHFERRTIPRLCECSFLDPCVHPVYPDKYSDLKSSRNRERLGGLRLRFFEHHFNFTTV